MTILLWVYVFAGMATIAAFGTSMAVLLFNPRYRELLVPLPGGKADMAQKI